MVSYFKRLTDRPGADELNLENLPVLPKNFLGIGVRMRSEMTPWERLQSCIELDEWGNCSPEYHRVKDSTLISGLIGGLVGGLGRGRNARIEFLKNNLHTAWESPLKAKEALQFKITMGFASGFYRISWRLGLFTFMFMSTSCAISAYKNKIGVLDHVVGGALAGMIYKLRQGPKATVAGTVVGAALGLFSGALISVGITMQQISPDTIQKDHYERLYWKRIREDERRKDYNEKEKEEIIREAGVKPVSDIQGNRSKKAEASLP